MDNDKLLLDTNIISYLLKKSSIIKPYLPHLSGKPIIEGTRISVEFILELLASDVSEDEIIEDYPHITKDDIHACLRYAPDSFKNDISIDPC